MPPILKKVLRSARLKHIPNGQIILYENDLPREVFILKSGIVKIYDIDEQGSEKILHLVKSPAVIPFAFFSGMHDPLRWFYTALTDCEVYTLDVDTLQAMTREDSKLSEALTNRFSDDIHELLARLSSLGKTNTQDKVLAALKFLLARHTSPRRAGWRRVNFPINHQLIADLCGITRESTALVMKDLQTDKIIRSPKMGIVEINSRKFPLE